MNNTTSDKNVDSIEKDIERCKQLTKSEHASWIGISNQLAITNILAELERKDKRIQELERKYLHEKLAKEEVEELLGNSIPAQKVMDELKRLSVMLKKTMEGEIQEYTVEEIIIRSNALQELLEGEK